MVLSVNIAVQIQFFEVHTTGSQTVAVQGKRLRTGRQLARVQVGYAASGHIMKWTRWLYYRLGQSKRNHRSVSYCGLGYTCISNDSAVTSSMEVAPPARSNDLDIVDAQVVVERTTRRKLKAGNGMLLPVAAEPSRRNGNSFPKRQVLRRERIEAQTRRKATLRSQITGSYPRWSR